MIIGDKAGKPRRDFHGTLSFSWPKTAGQFTLNKGKPGYDPQFALGYGLSYGKPGKVGTLDEVAGFDASALNTSIYFAKGVTPAPFSFATDSKIARAPIDGPQTQEGAQQLSWPEGPAALRIGGKPINLGREANGDLSLALTYRLDRAAMGTVTLAMGEGKGIDATSLFTGETGKWRTVKILLKCYQANGTDMNAVSAPVVIRAAGPLMFSLSDARIVSDPANSICPGTK